jgi:DNA helicase-2/ATP-dependent DNA helicase PcrA
VAVELDEAQRRVAEQLDGGLLVLAPVGSGKTLALTERIGRALASGRFESERILTLTFTNRAAQEVRQRLTERYPELVERLWICTFHGLCATILRREARNAGLPSDFTICDEADSHDLLRELSGREPRELVWFQRDLEQAKVVSSARALTWPLDYGPLFEALGQGRALALRYQEELAARGLLDFADLVLLTNALFARRLSVRKAWAERFDLIQVDEVQDTHRSEYHVIWVLAQRHRNLALFGDLDQTIYGWRGSEPDTIVEQFRHDFAPVVELQLLHNRRATRRLVEAADRFATSLEQRRTTVLPDEDAPSGQAVVLHRAPDRQAEARWIAERIQELAASEPEFAYSQVGILTGTNQRAAAIAATLGAAGLPHVTVEAFDFFRRQEVKDALAYLRLLLNPDEAGALQRVLERPSRGIGPGTLGRLRREAEPLGLRLVDFIRSSTFTHGDPFGPLLEAHRGGHLAIFDLETTGLNALEAEIAEVAAVRLEAGQQVERFETLVRPSRQVGRSSAVHGLTDSALAAGLEPREALEQLFSFVESCLLVGHNVAFDLRMLLFQAHRLGVKVPELIYEDTLRLARRFLDCPGNSLEELAAHLKLAHQPSHRALPDVLATCDLLAVLLSRLEASEAQRQELVDREAAPFAELAEQLAEWRGLAEQLRPAELLERVLEQSGLVAHYRDEPRRSDNLRALVEALADLDQPALPPAEALYRVVGQATLQRGLEQPDPRLDRVAVITIHQAKGLEFETVFIPGLVEGELPRRRSVQEGRLDEERRLFYVALTRARKRLFLSTHRRDDYGLARPSRLLEPLRSALEDRT